MTTRFHDVVTPAERRSDYLANGLWDDTTLAGQLAAHAAATPASIAVVDERGRYDYATLARDTAAFATALAERGVALGDVVSVQLPNRYEAVVAAIAAQSLGAVINPLLPNYRVRELAHVFSAARPAANVTPGDYRGCDHRSLIGEVAAGAGYQPLHVVVDGEPGDDGVAFETMLAGRGSLDTGRADAVSEVIFTSGTEATPKAVMHTEQTANFSVRVAHADLGVGGGDVVWMPSPVGHSTGFNYGVRFAVYHGRPLVLQDRWDPVASLAMIERERCSYTLAATTFLQDLTEVARREGTTVPAMRLFGCGGAPVPAALVEAAAQQEIGVLRLYGATEFLVATWNRPHSSADHRERTDGIAMSHVEIAARATDGAAVGPGVAGEAIVRGPNACVGFYDDPERTAATFDADGWVRTGDVITLDEEGYASVVGRKKEIIIRGGLNIAPREIEDLVSTYPEVDRAAVVGLPDDRLGERMCVCVVLREGATIDLTTITDRLREAGTATYKLPERLAVLDQLPTTASGKVQKYEIVRWLTDTDRMAEVTS